MPDDAPEIQINVPPELQVGVYANFATVSAQTEFDFNLDFIQLVPGNPGQPPEGHVVSRVKVAHRLPHAADAGARVAPDDH